MKISLCTLHNNTYAQLANITLRNKREYCEKHGYELYCKTENFKYSHLGFEKINVVLETFERSNPDWMMWLGCDTLITNHTIKIEDRIDDKYDLIISSDSNWLINSDSFIVKNSNLGRDFFKKVLNLYDVYINNPFYEQACMIDLINSDRFRNSVKIVPQKMLNSYNYDMYPHIPKMSGKKDFFGNYGEWEYGDFILHWPGVTMSNRMSLANTHSGFVIK